MEKIRKAKKVESKPSQEERRKEFESRKNKPVEKIEPSRINTVEPRPQFQKCAPFKI